jgi:hypothetical protein
MLYSMQENNKYTQKNVSQLLFIAKILQLMICDYLSESKKHKGVINKYIH